MQVITDPQTAEKLDENHNEDKYGNGDVASSPTSSLAIEGFVSGASEDNRVQSQSAAYVHEVLTLSIQVNCCEVFIRYQLWFSYFITFYFSLVWK